MNNIPLNSSPSPKPQTFKVLPPQQRSTLARPTEQSNPIQPAVERTNSPQESQPKKNSLLGLVTTAGIILVIGAIGYIPIPNYVTGDTEISSRINKRQQVTMPVSGRLKLHIGPNQLIRENDLIAEVESDERDNQRITKEEELVKAKQSVFIAQQQLEVARTRLGFAQNGEAIARDRANRQVTDLRNPDTVPLLRRLESEKAIVPSEIGQIEAEIFSIQADMTGLQNQLILADQKFRRYESFNKDGIIPQNELEAVLERKKSLESQIQQRQGLIASKQSQIQQKQGSLAVKDEQVKEARKQMSDTLYNYQDALTQARSDVETARREVEKEQINVQTQQQYVQKLEESLVQLQGQQNNLKLYANISGTATSENLDLLENNNLEMGKVVLDIVDMRNLSAEVLIRQEDKDFIKPGAKVQFVEHGGTVRYKAIVEDKGILPVVRTPEKQQKPMLKVIITIENKDMLLRPGMTGYAHIKTGELRIYQKVGHELNKLFNVGKYLPWIPG
ncbi:HlyD family efflux transporter periplasmic adaptor subunit [Oscillatoria sp. FACHB-1406]|uniref:HlyD family secretion protein n=1 Tax=Oscillatoria sp. FACHB-1406 TaxID=2692846 RepID=UPI0016882568|nr:HlyD family efflux transporter periplasmic adaptor subunit [Oscillatoria sp. FACHB-1406]MBD2579798.1 HlyD family efflux transporter periplasmic adaptor subunit [Oscillatoria sp. FACHB-1406]